MERVAGSISTLALLGGLVIAQEFGCGTPTPPEPDQELQAVLEQVSPGVVLPALSAFHDDTEALQAAVDAWAADPTAKPAAQQAWVDAMTTWQRLDPVALGPLGSPLNTVGGAYLRDEIYSWPTVNACLVDQQTLGREYDEPDFLTTSRVNAYGLDALERLLFGATENACPGQVPINADGTWAALGAAEIDAARAEHASALAAVLSTHAQEAIVAWEAHRMDETVYGSEKSAMDGLFAALYNLDTTIADRKLAEPFFQRNCTTDCASLVESFDGSELSNVWLQQNLRGLEALYLGGDGVGLDDLLLQRGEDALAQSIREGFDAAKARADAVDQPLDALYAQDEAAALDLLASIRSLMDLLEDDMAPKLALTIPAEAGGDND